jgi:hypothetical protein
MLIDKEKPDYLLQVDPDDYLDYLVQQIAWEPLQWHEDAMTVESFFATTERDDGYGSKHVTHEARLRLRVLLSPHPQLDDFFKYGPSSTRSSGEPRWRFEGSGAERVLMAEVRASGDAKERVLDEIKFWIGGRNQAIEQGNRTLREMVRPVWEARRKQLEAEKSLAEAAIQKLHIPLHQDPSARAKPIALKPRELRVAVAKPPARPRVEPELSASDVKDLVDFIEAYARSFEVTPTTYARFEEEELRDLLIGMMNANYPGSSSAETFSNLSLDIERPRRRGGWRFGRCKQHALGHDQ